MVHGYHAIFGAYGFWLPNDPRGSWSDFVGAWELFRFGKTTRSIERRELTPEESVAQELAKKSLKFPAVHFDGQQAQSIGNGFAESVQKSGFSIWACSILPEHIHLVIGRHRYRVEGIVNQLKGAATTELIKTTRHPLATFAERGERPPSPWARRLWKVFLDTEESILNAIHYVEQNPIKEGKPAQRWRFIRPFEGLPTGAGWVTYH